MERKKKLKFVDLTEFGFRGGVHVRPLSLADQDILHIRWFLWNEGALRAVKDHDKEMLAGAPNSLLGTAMFNRARMRGPDYPDLELPFIAHLLYLATCKADGERFFRITDTFYMQDPKSLQLLEVLFHIAEEVLICSKLLSPRRTKSRLPVPDLPTGAITKEELDRWKEESFRPWHEKQRVAKFIRKYCDKYSPGSPMFSIMVAGNPGFIDRGARDKDGVLLDPEHIRDLAAKNYMLEDYGPKERVPKDVLKGRERHPIQSGRWHEVLPHLKREANFSEQSIEVKLRDRARASFFLAAGMVRNQFGLLAPAENIIDKVTSIINEETTDDLAAGQGRRKTSKYDKNPKKVQSEVLAPEDLFPEYIPEEHMSGFYRSKIKAAGNAIGGREVIGPDGEAFFSGESSTDVTPEAELIATQAKDRFLKVLTKTERKVFECMVDPEGNPAPEAIAEKQGMTREAVDVHIHSIRKKISPLID